MAEYIDKNPYPYSDKETQLEYNFEDKTESGIPRDEIENNELVNEAITKSFDNAWVSARAYPGKFMEHKWAHVSIWDRTGELTLKTGFFYRIFRCRITLLKAEESVIATFIDCNIDKVTKLDSECLEPSKWAKMVFINCRMPYLDDCKNYFMSFEGETYLDEFTNTECCELTFSMTKKWVCSPEINNLKKVKKSKIVVRSARWISGDGHTSNFKSVEDTEISIFGTDMVGRCNNFTGLSRVECFINDKNISIGKSYIGGGRSLSRMFEQPDSSTGDRVDKETLTNSDSTVASKSDSPWEWYNDKSWDIYAVTEKGTASNSMKGWEGEGICAEKTVEGMDESSFILLDGKYKATEANYEGVTKSTMLATNSEIISDNGWNYQASESIINASGTSHIAKGGKDNLETSDSTIGIILSTFDGPVPHTFNNTNDVVRLITTNVTNSSGMGKLGTKTLYEEVKNNFDVKQDVSNITECVVVDCESIHKSSNANCYTANKCKMTTQSMTLDPKTNSLNLTDCNAVDTKSSLKGTTEINLSNTTLKIDEPTFDGSKSVNASNSTLQASASTQVVTGTFDSVIYDLQNAEVKEISITGKSTGRLFHVTSDKVTMDDSHGEFEACTFKEVALSKVSLLTHNSDMEEVTIDSGVYDFRTSNVKTLDITNKSSGRLSKVIIEDATMDDSSGEFEGCTLTTLSLTKSSLLSHNTDAETLTIDTSTCDIRTATTETANITNSTGTLKNVTNESLTIESSSLSIETNTLTEVTVTDSKVDIMNSTIDSLEGSNSQINLSNLSGAQTIDLDNCSSKMENTSSGITNITESSCEVNNSDLGTASISNGRLLLSKSSATISIDDSSSVVAANCSGSLTTTVESVSLMGDGEISVSGNSKTLVNKDKYENTLQDNLRKALNITNESEISDTTKALNIMEESTVAHTIKTIALTEEAELITAISVGPHINKGSPLIH